MAIAIHLRRRIGQTDATIAVVIVDRVIRVVGQVLVKRDGMAFQANYCLIHAEIGDLGRGMPCGARGQLVTLQQHDIAPALLGQMIQR